MQSNNKGQLCDNLSYHDKSSSQYPTWSLEDIGRKHVQVYWGKYANNQHCCEHTRRRPDRCVYQQPSEYQWSPHSCMCSCLAGCGMSLGKGHVHFSANIHLYLQESTKTTQFFSMNLNHVLFLIYQNMANRASWKSEQVSHVTETSLLTYFTFWFYFS